MASGASALHLVWRSLGMLRAVRGVLVLLLVIGVIASALPYVTVGAFGPMMQVISEAGNSGNLSGVWNLRGPLVARQDGLLHSLAGSVPFAVLLAVWAGSLVLTQLMYFVNAWIGANVERVLLVDIRQRVHDHLQSLSLDFFLGSRSGELMHRVMTESAGVQRLLTDCLLPPLIDAVVLVVVISYLLAISWQMTVAALVLTPLALITLRFAGRHVQAVMKRVMNAERAMAAEVEQTISGIAEIQMFNAQPVRSKRFHDVSEEAAKGSAASVVWMQATVNGSQIFVALSTVVVLLVGVGLSSHFGLTFAGLLVFAGVIPAMFGAAQRVLGAYTTYKSLAPNVMSTYELLDTQPSVREAVDAAALGEVHGNLVFEDVTFGYVPGQNIIEGMSFSVAEGETVGLVGGIGSGKSTVFNLLLRFRDPQHGRILLDGHDISTVTIDSLRDQVSKLAQFPFFIKDTIRENIRLARPQASDADIEEACAQAHIHSVITTKMHDGYDTVVDVQVPSGGQKRLIALARCLLRRPEVLLLDEPTENLDADERSRLIGVIRGYASERTCMVVSHDLDFIAAVADRILVLEDGRITQSGDHQTLMDQGGLYKRLHEVQNAR
ncbi:MULTISPECIES: ABC transporter ATP-binding protein [unclassified Mycolicibacterium]|uniref:ABC transporter ATP-binding protein n=1 Tax=unclassified Mycolicibacterium TaxID=2636767 RepID=UPI00130C6615|nr:MULTISPECIES: ABC transporter ATP-binding protein [unclassified Mycolicibacterium]MUL82073.1 ABC transporter ATP-binding protein [Mycolicibacterium sp. CBMA 329]MUL87839.1 ABC transporter ATP-binding protein [Mycolicibacterium sp. CBMA 331]MUM01662.1 ABC transporter ATP-binding protein [Mycolicibacterium sp. CBMA 334]MUM38136.1 ABC transporter ATP-binding protein [Mycolicibacterium sp. CBMA 247]MUM43904.1 ABC transporter ATP-binding protein [Mycolicibacterium sp. CBMA 294]